MSIHLPDNLVKFTSANTGKSILTSQTLRWSAPHLFSDPFELNHHSQLNFDPQALLQSAIKLTTAMIFGRDDPSGSTPLIAAIRRWRSEERFSDPEEAEVVLKELLGQLVDQRIIQLDNVMNDWRKFSRNLRICAFTAKVDNLLAWQNYADQHQGMALRFQTGEFTGFANPVKMNYSLSRPEITTLKEQISVMIYNTRVIPQEDFFEKFSIKPNSSNGEQEWRCFFEEKDSVEANTTDTPTFKDIKFELSELKAIYFGALMPTALKREVLQLVKTEYKQTKVYQAKPIPGRYELDFERI